MKRLDHFPGGGNIYLEFPVDLFKAPNIEVINMNLACDLNGTEESLRAIKNCSKLIQFFVQGRNGRECRKYIKEFNELPSLRSLNIAGSGNYHIDVSEVSIINPSLTQFIFLQGEGCDSNCLSHWREEFSGMRLEKITRVEASHGQYLPVDILPEYFKEMRAMSSFSGIYTLVSYNNRFDTFVNTWYDYITSWDQITMSSMAKDGKRNQFYGTYMDFYSSYYPHTDRPSGTLQAPAGFVKGSQNGDPQSPMEKIYVLTNNYGENWHLKPASTSARSARPFEMVFVDGRAIIADGDLITSFPKEYCYSKEEAVSLCKEHGVDEKPVIEWFENRGVGIPED